MERHASSLRRAGYQASIGLPRGATNCRPSCKRRSLRNDLERVDVLGPDHPEVPLIESRDRVQLKPLRDSDKTCIDAAETVIRVLLRQLDYGPSVSRGEIINREVAVNHPAVEVSLRSGPQLAFNQPVRLATTRAVVSRSPITPSSNARASLVILVTGVRVGEKDPGVDQQRHDRSEPRPKPSPSISSASRACRPDVDAPRGPEPSRCLRGLTRSAMNSSANASGVVSRLAASTARAAATSSESVTEVLMPMSLRPVLRRRSRCCPRGRVPLTVRQDHQRDHPDPSARDSTNKHSSDTPAASDYTSRPTRPRPSRRHWRLRIATARAGSERW